MVDLRKGGPAVWTRGTVAADPATSVAKRALDLVGSLVLLLFFSPLLLLAAGLIACGGDGPVLFAQERTGLDGRVIKVLKFRTLTVIEEGASVRSVSSGDPRVTPVGRVLRRLSVDELPQLVNVLKGDMSLVGPRPHAVLHDRIFSTGCPDYQRRFRAKPGLTGLAQVRGYKGSVSSLGHLHARVEADLRYIDRWSLGLDVMILARTLWAVLEEPGDA